LFRRYWALRQIIQGGASGFFSLFTLLSVVATALLSFAGPGMAVFAVLLFIMANIGFEGGLVFL